MMNHVATDIPEIDLAIPPLEASACGEDLEYAPEFVALLQAAVGKSEQQFGSAIIPAEPPDWHRIADDAARLLQRSRDIRIMGLLTRAWTETEGLAGYARGVHALAEALEQHWDAIHPRLYVCEEYDPMQRVNAIAAYADRISLAGCLRRAPLLAGPSGQLSLREAVAILESGDAADHGSYPGGATRLKAELRQAHGPAGRAVLIVQQILDAVARVRRVMTARLEPAWIPSFAPIEQPLQTIAATVATPGTRAAAQPAGAADGEAGLDQPMAGPFAAAAVDVSEPVPRADGIHSRQDAVRLLQQICDYLERSEPSHPAPMLIRRALRLLQMNFYEIVRELIPEGLARVDALAGLAPPPASDPPAG